MFNFLKKSRAFKFLCSSCLICSLGAFANVHAGEAATTIGYVYRPGSLGTGNATIVLDGAALSADNKLSGTLKWNSSGTMETLVNPDEDSTLVFYLFSSNGESETQIAASQSYDMTGKDFALDNVQMYSTTAAEAESTDSTVITAAPCRCAIKALVTPGTTSILSNTSA